MADIFVSYRKLDREIAERVVAGLEAHGFTVWWDDDLTPRESWDATIEREANAAKALIVLWTPRSVASEWVRAEAQYGKARNKLIPFMMETCEPPIAFSLTQAADLVHWRGDTQDEAWLKAIGWVAEQVKRPAEPSKVRQVGKGGGRWKWLAAAAVVVLAGAAGATWFALGRTNVSLETTTPGPLAETTPTSPVTAPIAPPVEAPLPPGPHGVAEAARRAFLAVPSKPECEGEAIITFDSDSATVTSQAVAAVVDPLIEAHAKCETAAVLVEGHVDEAETTDAFGLSSSRAAAVADMLDGFPKVTIKQAAFGAEDLAVRAGAGVRLKQNRRVVVRLRGLPVGEVLEAAYRKLGLVDPRDRSQPFGRILFAYNSVQPANEGDTARVILETWRDILAENPQMKVQVTAALGNDGQSREYQMALLMRRTRSVADYLASLGADNSRVMTAGLAREAPPGDTDVVSRMAQRSVYLEAVN